VKSTVLCVWTLILSEAASLVSDSTTTCCQMVPSSVSRSMTARSIASTFARTWTRRLLDHDKSPTGSSPPLGRPGAATRYLSSGSFLLAGRVLEAWASHKSFSNRKDRDPNEPGTAGRNASRTSTVRNASNKTHASTTDSESDAVSHERGQRHEDGLPFSSADGDTATVLIVDMERTYGRNGAVIVDDDHAATGVHAVGARSG